MLKRMKLIVALFLATLMAAAIGGAVSAPASAAAPGGITIGAPLSKMSVAQCAPNGEYRFCVWKNQTNNGAPDYFWTIPTGSNPPGWCVNFGSAINDQIRSIYLSNGPARSATLKQHAGCTGIANAFVDQVNDTQACWTNSWWPGCSAGLNQASSVWILKV